MLILLLKRKYVRGTIPLNLDNCVWAGGSEGGGGQLLSCILKKVLSELSLYFLHIPVKCCDQYIQNSFHLSGNLNIYY